MKKTTSHRLTFLYNGGENRKTSAKEYIRIHTEPMHTDNSVAMAWGGAWAGWRKAKLGEMYL